MEYDLKLVHPPICMLEPVPIPIYLTGLKVIPALSDMYLLAVLRTLQSRCYDQIVRKSATEIKFSETAPGCITYTTARITILFVWADTPEEFWANLDDVKMFGKESMGASSREALEAFKILLAKLVTTGALQEKNTKLMEEQ